MKAQNPCRKHRIALKHSSNPPLPRPLTIKYELSFRNFHFEDEFVYDENQVLSIEKLNLLDKVIDCIKEKIETNNNLIDAVDKEMERVEKVVEDECKRYLEELRKEDEEERRERQRRLISQYFHLLSSTSTSSSSTSSDEERNEKEEEEEIIEDIFHKSSTSSSSSSTSTSTSSSTSSSDVEVIFDPTKINFKR